jgi:hypothetical protein
MHLPRLSFRTCARRTVAAVLGLSVLLVAGAAPAAAYDPADLFELEPTPTPRPTVVPPAFVLPRPVPPPAPGPTPQPQDVDPVGVDVSWPQCNDELPETVGFAIVGVNRGRTYSENHCLLAQLEWAGQDADVYLNTANPGPEHSRFWPVGQSDPVSCADDDDDTHECAYLYGWNAAADAYDRVLAAHVALRWADEDADRLESDATWWLDVETANSWRFDRTLNVAALHGAVDFLESMDVAEVGFYSTPLLWWRVTHATDDFADYPAWHAGGRTRAGAEERCDGDAFTGGELRMVQWIEDGLDHNVRCS